MITKKQFDVLVFLSDKHESRPQREIAKDTKMSVGTVNLLQRRALHAAVFFGGRGDSDSILYCWHSLKRSATNSFNLSSSGGTVASIQC